VEAVGGTVSVWLVLEVVVDADVTAVTCAGEGVDAGRTVDCEVDTVTTGLEADADDGWTPSEVRSSDAELDWTVADGTGWATPAQTTDVGVTLLATVDCGATLANPAGNIVEGGMKGNPPGPGT